MDLDQAKLQLENVQKLAKGIEKQNRIFDETLTQAVKGADKSDKPEIERIIALSKRAIGLAKQGKSEEAQELIRNFKPNGSKNN